jgi:tetratricopeptide (TPR) repeat protein
MNTLAGLYESQDQHARAEPLYRRALEIREKAFGPDHPGVVMILENMAWLYREMGRDQDAELLERRAAASLRLSAM